MTPAEALASVRVARRADLGLGSRPSDVSLDARRALERLSTPLLAPRAALERALA
jgi:hypothetical protein